MTRSFGQTKLALLGLAIVLAGFNWSVIQKERTLSQGSIVKVMLAPRDPRALMTGDYMTLNTDLANNIRSANLSGNDLPRDSYAIVMLNDQQVAKFVRVQNSPINLAVNEVALKFRNRQGEIVVGTNAFYFQEGQAALFEQARYGEYRVGSNGEMLLTHLLNEQLQRIEARPASNRNG